MIAVDSSALIAFLAGATGRDTDLVDRLLADRQACLPPVMLTEMLSDPTLPKQVAELLVQVPRLEVLPGSPAPAARPLNVAAPTAQVRRALPAAGRGPGSRTRCTALHEGSRLGPRAARLQT